MVYHAWSSESLLQHQSCEYVIRIVYIRKNKFQFCAIMSTIKPDEVKTRLFLKDKNYTEQDKYVAMQRHNCISQSSASHSCLAIVAQLESFA